jgi:hypothetical protein
LPLPIFVYLPVDIAFLRCWTVIAPNIIVGGMV